ncbi:uncharacterized protein TrAFT101_010596 [Trichoderma asperellum]|uniref:Rieske domain-containing protein n=1 Tax=Trichoderma asperellum (strain ATCC 204424 / CBS 433.97 / NBRC 101777) TaxID=1042311 RepID=A0A2T3YT47_TRIA4|nr:hypothetical protein M441DRAFT_73899 [Trichoderma asperellum CBS 433.97]PTB35750.1 hypothetical protein M441DRAFT_73899 [Trichoderma asperellum CBS 433.97]UKZ95781.1 hypothetical protein TrAFT101_010596 [Trichoderma asperellum]
MKAFEETSQLGAEWFSVGLASSFPDLGLDDDNLAKYRTCGGDAKPGCKVFQVPREDSLQSAEVTIREDGTLQRSDLKGLKDQVLVFRYKGKFHAVDHICPHSSYPLSQGTPFDIEDFGVILSAGLTCPKHGWSFDIFTGTADRGNYQLDIWETQLRETKSVDPRQTEVDNSKVLDIADKEVWVRRRQQGR